MWPCSAWRHSCLLTPTSAGLRTRPSPSWKGSEASAGRSSWLLPPNGRGSDHGAKRAHGREPEDPASTSLHPLLHRDGGAPVPLSRWPDESHLQPPRSEDRIHPGCGRPWLGDARVLDSAGFHTEADSTGRPQGEALPGTRTLNPAAHRALSLRGGVRPPSIGETQSTVDGDVIQADAAPARRRSPAPTSPPRRLLPLVRPSGSGPHPLTEGVAASPFGIVDDAVPPRPADCEDVKADVD